MKTITLLAGLAAFGMVVLYGYMDMVSNRPSFDVDYQVSVDNSKVSPLAFAAAEPIHQDDVIAVEERNTTTNDWIQSNVTPNSTLKIYRNQNTNASNLEKNTISTVKGHKMPLQITKLPTTSNKSYPSIMCPASNLGKPNPSLTQCLLEAIHEIPNETFPDDLRIFNPNFSIAIHKELLELLQVFHKEVTSHNLTYFITGGTLIGSWRHHGFIPWDDDADVYMNVQDKPRLKTALSKLSGRYGHFTEDGALRWKLYVVKIHQFENETNNWAYPFLDICFYKKNETYIQDLDPVFWNSRYEIDSVFPVTLRPFYHIMLLGPRDTAKILNEEYNSFLSTCWSTFRDHRRRKQLQKLVTSCSKLYPYFPFVKHAQGENGPLESLVINESVIYCLET